MGFSSLGFDHSLAIYQYPGLTSPPDSDSPSYESVIVMSPADGGAGGGGPCVAALTDPEQRRLADKMFRSMVRLNAILELYNPSKYSPEVCRVKEEMWTEKIEISYLELQEDMYRFKDYSQSIGRPENGHDEAVSGIAEAVS